MHRLNPVRLDFTPPGQSTYRTPPPSPFQKGQVQQQLRILLVGLFSNLPIRYNYVSLIESAKEFKAYNPWLPQVI